MTTTPAQIDLWRRAPSECQNLEFKEAKNNFDRERLLAYCVAIANEGGGHLVLGVADRAPRLVVGSMAFENLVKTADQLFVKLGFRVDLEEVAHPEGRVIVFHIPSRPRGTAYHLDGKYLMRSGESLVPMSEDRLRTIFAEGGQAKGTQAVDLSRSASKDGLIYNFTVKPNQITAHVHNEYSLGLDDELRTALDEVNAVRRERGFKDYYPANRFRLIRPPRVSAGNVELDLIPTNFMYLAAIEDQNIRDVFRNHTLKQLTRMHQRLPSGLQSDDPVLNGLNHHLLGVQVALVTNDKRTLLRKRGQSVLLARSEWDVSYSGYCGDDDKLPTGEIYVGNTVEHELRNEIGTLTGDSRKIIFTGLHVNTKSGAIDVLCVWPLGASTAELVDRLSVKYPNLSEVFETTKKAVEPFVWDSENLIVDFNGPAIARALKRVNGSDSSPATLMPGQSYECLLRGLQATGSPTAQLNTIIA